MKQLINWLSCFMFGKKTLKLIIIVYTNKTPQNAKIIIHFSKKVEEAISQQNISSHPKNEDFTFFDFS